MLTLANTELEPRRGESGREIHYLTETKLVHVGVVSGQSIFDLFFSVSFREILFVDRTFKLSSLSQNWDNDRAINNRNNSNWSTDFWAGHFTILKIAMEARDRKWIST